MNSIKNGGITYVRLPTTINRKLPLALLHPVNIEHKVLFTFPEEINWKLDFNPLVIKNDGINYQRTTIKKGKSLEISHSYKSINDTISVSDISDHISQLKEIKNALYISVINPNPNKKSNIKSVLRSLLNKK